MFSFTENLTANVLAGLHTGQHILDFGKGGGVLISFLSDLTLSVGPRVIPSKQLLCILALSQMKFPGGFTSSAVTECKLKAQCFVLGAKSCWSREKGET